MVSVSGIRGRVGESLTPEVVARYAAAFGAWSIGQGTSRKIVVGRDSRVSGRCSIGSWWARCSSWAPT